ncbi:MAG: UDP-N-acetylglucosamine 2-epimerase (non-hydrolyzing) [Bacteroidetes bacterium]|nr:UDP-N-acetylglucosamine 2-epimerase (non-hydrolyzing) [Bacteroidota bacterium]
MKIFSIVGARPQFIKLAPLSAALQGHQEFIVHTGQHYDYAMSEKIFLDLGIRKPDIHLEVGAGNQTTQITAMMLKLEKEMLEKKPDLVIVFGDTNSTLAGALIAAKQNIPLVHIEAGLRSFNRTMPEEINRIVTDHVSQYLFAPTQTAVHNLATEGLAAHTHFTGDIMVDTMQNSLQVALEKSTVIKDLQLEGKTFNLLTLHRHYNVDDAAVLQHILEALEQLGETIIFPVHPRTRKMLDNSSYTVPGNIQLTEPQGYLDFVALEYGCKRIISDSGGIQKEAYILRKPCITLRSETEWVETVQEKWNLLINPSEKNIAAQIAAFVVPEVQHNIFGEDVAAKMVQLINAI